MVFSQSLTGQNIFENVLGFPLPRELRQSFVIFVNHDTVID